MDLNSPPPCPNTVTVRRNPPRRARPTPFSSRPPPVSSKKSEKTTIIPFPTDDILSMEIPESSAQIQPPVSESLKVYLRIRPLVPPKSIKEAAAAADQNYRRRNKNAWPQNPTVKKNAAKEKADKKKNNEVCISVKDSQSVTLAPPQALQDSKRIKSVVYEGFSHVFPSDISQSEVYEKMVKPLVEDFVNGKSGMLAALGPSGSGKTHTVFGTVREPGMVPLALQHIFKQTLGKQSRSFYISIFEISSEGKSEKILDLSPDGADLSMQQSVIKGIQEVPISSAEQAESLIASAMLKRATAMTNTNSQSSRSQCIINIHSLFNKSKGESDVQPNNAVVTIVDLAGAERERRTGNQGSRLLESNFINNTSMVFGLCLRSLLEHQKNPKKPLQKHFQNSLLTRYLRDYLEGKKRMALILTVKPGEEDYLDTSYLLRQASPYMNIKFNNVEEQSNPVIPKRRMQSSSRNEDPKRKKYCDPDAHVIEEGKKSGEELEEARSSVPDAPRISKSDIAAIPAVDCTDFTGERNHQIMQNFAKAIWKVLKEYKEKLRVAEKEIGSLNENLVNEKARYIQLEKEHEVFKSFCTCSKEISVEANFLKADKDIDVPVYLDENEYDNVHKADVSSDSHNHKAAQSKCTPRGIEDVTNQMNVIVLSPDPEECKYGTPPVYAQADENSNSSYHKAFECANTPGDNQDATNEADVSSDSHNHKGAQSKCTPRGIVDVTNQMNVIVLSPDPEECKCSTSPVYAQADENSNSSNHKAFECASTPGDNQDATNEMDAAIISPDTEESKCSSSPKCAEADDELSDFPYHEAFEPASTPEICCLVDNRSRNHKASLSECTPRGDEEVTHQADENSNSSNHKAFECASTPGVDQDATNEADVNSHSHDHKASQSKCTSRGDKDITIQMDATVVSPDIEEFKSSSSPKCAEADENGDSPYHEAFEPASTPEVDKHSHNHKASLSECTPRGDVDVTPQMDAPVLSPEIKESKCDSSPGCSQDFSTTVNFDVNTCSPNRKASERTSTDRIHHIVSEQKPLNLPQLHKEDEVSTKQHNFCEPDCEIGSDISGKSLNLKKPKRRLLPASSILLRDITILGIEDEPEKPKGNRGGKKVVSDERTKGSTSLVRLLQSNLRLR